MILSEGYLWNFDDIMLLHRYYWLIWEMVNCYSDGECHFDFMRENYFDQSLHLLKQGNFGQRLVMMIPMLYIVAVSGFLKIKK